MLTGNLFNPTKALVKPCSMKKSFLLALSLVFMHCVNAQTWTGSSSSNWNTLTNWDPAVIPTLNDVVTIPGGLGRYPVLSGNTTVRQIDMQAGSRIDVNGFALSVIGNGFNYFTGATLNNSNATTDIILNLTTGSLGFTTYFRGTTINDNIIYNLSGIDTYMEGDTGPSNQFNGNVTYNIIGTLGVNISQSSPSIYTGNVTVNRTVHGQSNMFFGGANIAGNYSFTDSTGSITLMGSNAGRTDIGGRVNVALYDPSTISATAFFEMHRFVNHTTGGTINVGNSAGFLLEEDTLKAAALIINGTRGNVNGQAIHNDITAAVTISDNAIPFGSAGIYMTNNLFTGSFTLNKNNAAYPVYEASNRFVGNTVFNCGGAGPLQLCWTASSVFDGNLTINRTVAGYTEAFTWGATINGNFTYTNLTAGDTHLGNFFGFPNRKTLVSGTVNITAHYTTPDIFALDDITNLTPGGNVEVLNSKGVDMKTDTLLVNNVTLTGYRGNFATIFGNKISGNFTLADDATNSSSFYTELRNNNIAGTSTITSNGAGGLLDGYATITNSNYGSTYLGNVSYTRNNGQLYIGEGFSTANVNEYGANLTFNTTSDLYLGLIRFIGSTNGALEQLGTQPLAIRELTMAKALTAKLTLQDSLTIRTTANFTSGVIVSTAANKLIFADNATQTGASNASFVDGPVLKTGDDAFTFPVGNDGFYAFAAISAPAQTTDGFTAQYHHTPPSGSGYDPTQVDFTLNHVSSAEYWMINRTAGNSAVFVTLSWDVVRSGAISTTSDLRISHWDGTTWDDEGGIEITGTTSGTIKSLSPVNNFSPFTLASVSASNPLPLTLISFDVTRCGKDACLAWVTENEVSFLRFDVERSGNGRDFGSIAQVNANNDPGRNAYSSRDENALPGVSFYRLKMIDIDGQSTYSQVFKLYGNGVVTAVLSPNPATSVIRLENVGAFNLARIIDLNGKVLQQHSLNGSTQRLNVSGLANGMYVIELSGSGQRQLLKLVKN